MSKGPVNVYTLQPETFIFLVFLFHRTALLQRKNRQATLFALDKSTKTKNTDIHSGT